MEQSSHRSNGLRRGVASFAVTASIVVVMSAMGAGTAHAVQSYVPCPDNRAGVGCGFNGGVGPGSYIITHRFKRVSGGYGAETHALFCPKDYCPVEHLTWKDPDRMPAGFDISSDSLFTSYEEFSY